MGCLRDIVVAQHGETHICGSAGPWGSKGSSSIADEGSRGLAIDGCRYLVGWSVCQARDQATRTYPKPARHMGPCALHVSAEAVAPVPIGRTAKFGLDLRARLV